MSFLKNIKSKYILLLILLLGFILRANNLTVGFPMLYLSNDEAIYHLSALNMIANRTIFSLGNYGPLGSYIQIPFLALGYIILFLGGKIHSISDMERLLVTQEGYFMFIPRVLSALFGTLIILTLYRLSFIIFKNKNGALWTAFFTAVSFNLVHISHLSRAFSPALFFCTLVALFSVYIVIRKNDQIKNTIFALIFSALAFGFHQITGVIVILPILAIIKKPLQSYFRRNVIIPLVLWMVLIALLNYLSLGGNILEVFRSNNNLGLQLIRTPSYWMNKSFGEILITFFDSIKIFWELFLTDGLILLFVFYFLFKGRLEAQIKIMFVLFTIVCMLFSIFVFPPILRYFLPVIVFLPLFAGNIAHRITKKSGVTALLIICIASFNSIYWNGLILKKPTFIQMRQWLDKNIPAETPVAVTFYRTVGYVPSKTSSAIVRKFIPGYYLRASNTLDDNNYPFNVRNILYLEVFNKNTKVDNLNAGLSVFPAQYIIDAYYDNNDRLLYAMNNLKLIEHFSPTGTQIYEKRIPEAFADAAENFPLFVTNRPGPYIDVLKIDSF